MSDEQTGSESQRNEGGAHEEVVPKSELSKVISQRQELKAKTREYEAKLAEYEARDKEREEEEMRKRGEFEKLLEAERAQRTQLEQQIHERNRRDRFSATVTAVAAKAGIDPVVTEGLLLREGQISGTDVAPEELTDDVVVGLAKALRKSAPHLFAADGKGGSPRIPGLNMANKQPGEDPDSPAKRRVKELAKALSNV